MRLKDLRERKNLTRSELGQALSLSYSAIAKYENEKGIPNRQL